ncbi:hypothetical protein [Salinibacter sp.]|uniref:capsular polysaccharide export protein, LipB/KpsS family n=1 Tax=Salinibacter sp. TaxID=2065818 RepID=UPI0021E8A056|nr:hypothetical protein [Salinibacter sp.]
MVDLVFFSHWSQIKSYGLISRKLRQRHDHIRTTLWTTSKYDKEKGMDTGDFTNVVNMKPPSSDLEVTESKHKSNLKWAKNLEERVGSVFLKKDLSQDRYFQGNHYPENRDEQIPIQWNNKRLYAYLKSVTEKVTKRIRSGSVDIMWVEMNSAVYRVTRRICQKNGIPALFYGRARMWGGRRGYLETENGFMWKECRDIYDKLMENEIPSHIRQKCAHRIDDIRERKSQPNYHTAKDKGRKKLWRRINLRRFWKNLQYWWRCRKEPWEENPRHLPSHVSSPLGQIRRFFQSWSSEKIYRRAVCEDAKLDRPYAIYFLHVQPEVTVEAMSFEYQDQVATIRNLVAGLPADIPLYVKEHKPMVGRRTKRFYAELAHIPGVVLVDDSIHSHTLIRKANVVLTLTGTVGLEAMVYGVPTIALGQVFYSHFRGVYNPGSIQEAQSLLNTPYELVGGSETDAIRMLASIYYASSYIAWPPDMENKPKATENLLDIVEQRVLETE